MTDVQARPAQLNTFATNGRTIHTTLETARTTNKSAFVAFRNAAGGGCAAQGDGIVNGAMTDLLSELDEIPKWVTLVHDALIAADVSDANGNVSISANDLTLRMIELAGGEKNFNELANSRQLSVPLPQVGTVPQDSGFVNDPVCTATGHLLVDARDFVMPSRLDVLSFRRTYASQYLHDGAFGPGWWSWTECHGSIAPDGSFEYVGPDGQELRLPAGAHGRFIRRPELDIDVAALDESTVRLRWGRRSRNPNQVWTFVGDRLAEVSGPFVGTARFEWDRRGRLTSITHDSGRTLTFRWKGARVVGIESTDGRRTRFDYNKAGHLVAVDNGRSPERYELDDQGRILWVTDADGVQTITMTYDDEGRVIAQVSETGFMTRFNYDEVRRTTLSDRDYNPLSVYTHDAGGRVEMYATGGGYRFTRRFDALGRVVSQRDADGTSFALVDRIEGGLHVEEITWSTGDVERYEYDGAERLVRQTSARSSMSFTYDGASMFPRRIDVAGDQGLAVDLEWAHGAPTRIADSDGVVDVLTIRPDGTIESATNGLGQTARYEVDACGHVTRITHPDGSTVRYERDAAGRVLAMVDAAGHRGEIHYTPAGRMLSTTDPNGAVTAIEYDAAGLPARVIAADGTETAVAFDDQQRIVGVRFANGDSIGLDLDEWGRQVAIEADDRRWETERDVAGRIVKRRDPSGDEIAQQYGELGGWMSITDAAGANWRLERDLVSRVRTLTTPSGREITARYNAEGMLTSQSTSDGGEQEISYTPAGRVESVTTAGNRIEFRYDGAGRMIGANTGSGWWTFDLDSNGRIVRRVSPAGREQRYGYNVLDQLTSINVAGEIWEFEYDTAGRVVRSTDPTGRSATYDYDAVGRMIESRDGLGTPLHYAYDPRGRIAAMVDGHDGAVRYEHNGLNQLTAITDQLGRRTNVHYDDAGRHVATTWLDPRRDAPSIPTLDQFGLRGADAVSFGDGAEPLAYSVSADGMSVTWTLTSGDQVELKRDADGLAESLTSPDFTRAWTRDDCGRVITVVDDRAGVVSVTTLRRDAAGRVIEQAVDGAVTQFGYDGAGQLVSSTSEFGRSTWEYDELGRLMWERTPEVLRSFRYDDAHQLVELTEGGAVTTFEYDARGRRVRAAGARDVVYVWGSTHLEAVVVDGVLQRFDTDASGALRRAGDVEIAWDTSFGTPRPVSVDGQRVLTVDGSTVGTVSADGSVEWRPFKLADAWGGEPEAADHAEWHDYFGVAVEGLVWLGARPYDVTTRQFLAPDPLAPLPGMPGSTSPYTYAANDPINLFDPTGRQPISIEAWNDVRDRRTGPQWQNIASVAIAVVAVAVTVVTLGSAGPLVMVLGGAAIGALAGGASGLPRESIESNMNLGDGTFNGDAIVKDVIVGAAGGALGGGAGAGFNALASTTRIAGTPVASFLASRGGSAFTEAVSGFGEGVLGEVYDVSVPRNWGADGTWNNDAIVTNTVVSTVAGGALHGVSAPGTSGADVPTTSSADPADIDNPNSPTPNQPDPAPASSDTGSADTTTSASEHGTTNSDTGSGSHDTRADTSTDTSSDTSTDTSDTSTDTTSDTSGDTGTDTSTDTTSDTSGDTTSDTSTDTTSDASGDTSTDTTSDTSTDTTSDTSTDTTSDTSGDTTSDTSTDTTSDASGDTSTDTTSDTSTDTTSDTSTDTTSDAPGDSSTDTTSDTSTDTTSDASGDSSTDTTSDTSTDTTSDASGDTSTDATSDTSTDTTSDASTDTTSDTASDTSGDTTSDTSDTASDTSDTTSDTSGDTTSDTSDTSTDTTSDTSDTSTDTTSDTSDTSTDTTSDTSDTNTDTTSDTSTDTADSSSDAQTDTTSNADTDADTDASSSNGDTDAEVAAAAAVVAPTAAAASASSASSASAASSASSASGTDTPSAANNGGDPPTTNGDSNDTAAGDGDSERLANVKADERNVSTRTDDNGMTRITREHDANAFEFTVDADGYTRAVKFEINESYTGLDRTSAETSAQERAARGGGQPNTDDGGHMAGHRFSNNQGDINQMAQNNNLNRGAYKKWENEMADWTARGYQVEGTVHANQPGGTRPDTIDITYVVSDASGNVVHYGSRSFVNQQGQTFNRVYGRQMDRATTLFEGRPAGDGPPLTDSGSAAGTNTTPSTEPADVDLSGPDAINTQTIDNQTIDNETIDNHTIDNETIGQQSPNDHLPSPRVPVNPVPAGIAAGDLTGGAPAGDLTTTMPETAPSTTLGVDVTGDLADSPSIPEPRSPMDAMQEGPEVDAPGTADADTTDVTGSTDTDQTVDPTDSADPDAGNPPETYTVDGQEYTPSFSPDQLNNAPTAHQAVHSVLSDNALFARHGFDPPWSRQDLIDAINTNTADLTPAQRDMLNAIRDRMPFPQPGETIQKVITPTQLRDYLNNVIAPPAAPNTVGGSQTRAVDSAHLRTPDELFDGLRLDYDRTPFRPGQNSVHVIRYVPSNDPEFALPRNSTMGGNARFDTWTDPFTGNGFTRATDDVVPEFQGVNTMRSGAEMWEIMSDGTQQLTAVLRGDVWVRVD